MRHVHLSFDCYCHCLLRFVAIVQWLYHCFRRNMGTNPPNRPLNLLQFVQFEWWAMIGFLDNFGFPILLRSSFFLCVNFTLFSLLKTIQRMWSVRFDSSNSTGPNRKRLSQPNWLKMKMLGRLPCSQESFVFDICLEHALFMLISTKSVEQPLECIYMVKGRFSTKRQRLKRYLRCIYFEHSAQISTPVFRIK